MRTIKKTLWLLLALAFLLEAWAWEQLQPLLAWLGRVLPWAEIRSRLENRLAGLHAWYALVVFIVPFAIAEPLKLVSLWLLTQGHFKTGLATFVIAYVATAGLSLFLFDILRPKLMTIAWFATAYGWIMRMHDWALAQTAPLRQRLRIYVASLRARTAGASGVLVQRFIRHVRLLRTRMRRGGGPNHML